MKDVTNPKGWPPATGNDGSIKDIYLNEKDDNLKTHIQNTSDNLEC